MTFYPRRSPIQCCERLWRVRLRVLARHRVNCWRHPILRGAPHSPPVRASLPHQSMRSLPVYVQHHTPPSSASSSYPPHTTASVATSPSLLSLSIASSPSTSGIRLRQLLLLILVSLPLYYCFSWYSLRLWDRPCIYTYLSGNLRGRI